MSTPCITVSKLQELKMYINALHTDAVRQLDTACADGRTISMNISFGRVNAFYEVFTKLNEMFPEELSEEL